MPSCSVIIRCCNEEKHVGRLLVGLMQQSVRDLEIILVDSGSTDSTLRIASQFPVKIVHIPREEFSFGRSLNFGCRAATSELLVIASAHVYPVYTDWIERLLEPFEEPEIGLTYGKQRGDKVTHFSEHQIFAKWFPNQSMHRQPTPFCNNANAAIRRSLWEERPYDESLTGLEDLDWARAIQAKGYEISYVAEAEIVHVHEETPTRIFNRYRREALALRRIIPEETFTARDFFQLFLGNALGDARVAVERGQLLRHLPEILMFRLMQFWGTYRGFAERPPETSALKEAFYYPVEEEEPPPPPDTPEQHPIDYASPGIPGDSDRRP